jgi:hypothetical protein
LGDLYDKSVDGTKMKGVVSSPKVHGFDFFASTQAQAPTSTPNCGCFPPANWPGPPSKQPAFPPKFPHQYPGEECVISGGVRVNESMACTNYWSPNETDYRGATNLTTKITGDDGEYLLETLDAFIGEAVAAKQPFLAALWMHYIHLPHPAMPQYYEKYEHDPDYVGTLEQLDASIGRLRKMLVTHGVSNDTLVLFTSDNGCHCNESPEYCWGAGRGRSTGGLRGCKASSWEGGVRVPGKCCARGCV